MVDAMTMPRLPQLRVVHASDIHFGGSHRFQPPITPSNNRPPSRGYPELSASILADLKRIEGEHPAWGAHENNPLILALTGDLTDTASTGEFEQAAALVSAFRAIRSWAHRSPATRRSSFLETTMRFMMKQTQDVDGFPTATSTRAFRDTTAGPLTHSS